MLDIVLAVVFLPFAGAALTPLVHRVAGERTAYYAAGVAAVCFALVARLTVTGTHGLVGTEWVPSLGISLAFYVDGLSLLISLLASGVGVLTLTYSGGYMHGEPGQAKYYATLLAFMGSMLGVALAADLFALFTFWELTSLSSFILIGHYTGEKSSQYAARKSMLITVAGGLFMLAGFLVFAWAGDTTLIVGPGSLTANAGETVATLRSAGLFLPSLLLLAIGAATKSAQVPFHVWLPNAMEAPTPVSAFLHSATMVKAGVYLVGRFRPFFLDAVPEATSLPEWSLLFVTLGLLTMTVTAILAVAATDIKELLAYSTASHLGLIVAGFGAANAYGAETGAFHILNHASFKAALFLVAGIVAHEAGTRKISKLRGLRHDLPVTALVAGLASLSMAGIPPFNGFYSKELLFEATFVLAEDAGGLTWLFPVVAVFGSVFTFLYSLKFLSLFLGDPNGDLGDVHRPPLPMLVPPVILGALVAVISVDPQLAIDTLVGEVYASTVPGDAHSFSVGLPTHLTPPVWMSAITIGVGALLWPRYDRLHDGIRGLLHGPVRANWWYDGSVDGLTAGSKTLVSRVQTGLLRTYATWVFAATSVLVVGAYLATGVGFPAVELADGMTAAMVLVLLVALVGAAAVGGAPSHVAGVLTLSILGFMVAIFYILADAPDLALTQLVVETLVLVLFLLVLDRLPAYYGSPRFSVAVRDGALSVLVGATVFLTVVFATAGSPDAIGGNLSRLAGVPAEHPPLFTDYGGGYNVVNVVLVDFRAIDTLGEITVVAMAALSVLTLVRMRGRGEAQ
ncbi:hydrogen gas-evolving membrane-bound hydrogenase subunit E [Halorarum halobium]|uniref:hydrogen gas-evolving membrane-bound hydrogenase subunit E n=1 Tax=Halorarum halobium TaxID=3075121 RepID=UPI0028A8ABC7|nr:hydrogen gas-evolving membrane-bound hydrogenase subunit E [Halobaculum sp. XH14]